MNRYSSRFLKIVIFIFLIFISDQVVGLILRELYFTQKAGPNQALIYSFNKCNADIIIFGASQASHNYDPRIISDSLKMSCYNAGQDGGHSILMQYAQILAILDRYSPKIIVLEFSPNTIVRYPGDYDRLSILLPYYAEYPQLRPIILLKSPYERVKLLSAIYPYNSNVINIVRFNIDFFAAREKDFDGYIPLEGEMSYVMLKPDQEKPVNKKHTVVDSNKVDALKKIISICREKDISLFIISSPIFHTVIEKQIPRSSVAEISLEILRLNKVNYIDFSSDPTFAGHFEWFKDIAHLNENGAKVFSNMVVNEIRGIKKGSRGIE